MQWVKDKVWVRLKAVIKENEGDIEYDNIQGQRIDPIKTGPLILKSNRSNQY